MNMYEKTIRQYAEKLNADPDVLEYTVKNCEHIPFHYENGNMIVNEGYSDSLKKLWEETKNKMQDEDYRNTVVEAIKNGAVDTNFNLDAFSPMADIVGTIRPAESGKKNTVAGVLRAFGWIAIVCGIIGGLILLIFTFLTAISVIVTGAISGIMLLGFAEIIDLLQELVNRSNYNVNLKENKHSSVNPIEKS